MRNVIWLEYLPRYVDKSGIRKHFCGKRGVSVRGREKICCIAVSFGITVMVAYLFYRSALGVIWFPVVYYMVHRKWKRKSVEKRKKQIRQEFKDAMQSVTTALTAGYSMENAWREAERELEELYLEKGILPKKFAKMNAAVRMNQPLEGLMRELADETEVEDIRMFAEVFAFAKRGGGDFIHIIETTSRHIREKIEVEQEMETAIAAKKMEQNMMSVIPFFILFYLDIASPGFLDLLYGNTIGVVVMTVSLVAYIGTLFLAERILAIEV